MASPGPIAARKRTVGVACKASASPAASNCQKTGKAAWSTASTPCAGDAGPGAGDSPAGQAAARQSGRCRADAAAPRHRTRGQEAGLFEGRQGPGHHPAIPAAARVSRQRRRNSADGRGASGTGLMNATSPSPRQRPVRARSRPQRITSAEARLTERPRARALSSLAARAPGSGGAHDRGPGPSIRTPRARSRRHDATAPQPLVGRALAGDVWSHGDWPPTVPLVTAPADDGTVRSRKPPGRREAARYAEQP